MLIDWFTVGAQALNFIILVWLMKRFLYQPVLDAIAAREHRIASALAQAAAAETQARLKEEAFEHQQQAFEAQRAGLLQQAQADAHQAAQRLQAQAQAALELNQAQQTQAWQTQWRDQQAAIVEQTQNQVVALSRRALSDLANAELDAQACEVFTQRLCTLQGEALASLREALAHTSAAEPARVRSGFAMSESLQASVQAACDACAGRAVPLVFETDSAVIAGVELSAQGQKVAWSVTDYLDSFARELRERANPNATPGGS